MPDTVIVVVGSILLDLVIETPRVPNANEVVRGKSIGRYCGGKAANTSIAAYRASHKRLPDCSTALIDRAPSTPVNERHVRKDTDAVWPSTTHVYLNGAVGVDETGTYLLEQISNNGVDVSQVLRLHGQESGTCVILVETETGDNRLISYVGATARWKLQERDSIRCMAGGLKPDLLISHLTIPTSEVQHIMKTACQDGIDTILNPSPAEHLDECLFQYVTHLVMNEWEAAILTGRSVEELHDPNMRKETVDHFLGRGVKSVVITMADRGAYYGADGGESGTVKVDKNVAVVDTTGAGDTFLGYYAVQYAEQKQTGMWNIGKAVKRACQGSAKTIQRLGAQVSIPWADEFESEGS